MAETDAWIGQMGPDDADTVLSALECMYEWGDKPDRAKARSLANRVITNHPTAGKRPDLRPLGEIDT